MSETATAERTMTYSAVVTDQGQMVYGLALTDGQDDPKGPCLALVPMSADAFTDIRESVWVLFTDLERTLELKTGRTVRCAEVRFLLGDEAPTATPPGKRSYPSQEDMGRLRDLAFPGLHWQ